MGRVMARHTAAGRIDPHTPRRSAGLRKAATSSSVSTGTKKVKSTTTPKLTWSSTSAMTENRLALSHKMGAAECDSFLAMVPVSVERS